MVIFVIAHCRNLQNIAQHRATAAEALISISAVVILKTSDANYHFRVKNGRDFQNDWVAPAPGLSLYKTVFKKRPWSMFHFCEKILDLLFFMYQH